MSVDLLHQEFAPRFLRSVFGLFATGVAVVTTRVDNDVDGVTINSFSSVSLEPALCLFCLDKGSNTLQRLQTDSELAITFLTAQQEQTSRYFALQSGGVQPEYWGEGAPFLVGGAGGLRCEVQQLIEAGDHVIVLCRIVALWQDPQHSDALLYYRGRYSVGKV